MTSLQRLARRVYSSLPRATDTAGIPTSPTWSVNELLASYPRPTLSTHALTRLHNLSALVPPKENSPEHAKLKSELEDLIRLVEAVKLVDTTGVSPYRRGTISSTHPQPQPQSAEDGRALLKHAKQTKDGFYVVNTDRNH
ncbi:hypothetical protein MIND_00719400 [Mycena indigotica]|uniref:Glutamyl-tRNA(Gln) amidotransferase subunit F, mitochondrial n=1 Tax=Mycena indigotica TaxID=2126181 RepID=A0A8H6W6X2_9AGAR|nr:uncharacterized protein MIND_00719400 [Mycena indigotica]KAF7301539.1 hypothetical protein MIND_00719400 [Mycena indigotica]